MNSYRLLVMAGAVGLSLGLTACATRPPPAVSPAPSLGTPRAENFDIEGRLSLRKGDSRHHVSIVWQHNAARDHIWLSGPLGQGLAELTRDAAGARLVTANRQELQAADWESLAEQAFGMRLPLAELPRWLADAGSADAAHGRPRLVEIDGWRIDWLEFAGNRPTLIELRRDDIEARFKIDRWNVLP